jgi:predicted PurR-regulated permease PerM
MSLLVSVYMLLEKEKAQNATKRIVHGIFKPSTADRVSDAGRKIDMIFKRYFAGKLLQAVAIMILAYVVLLIGGVKYAILFAVILRFTNLIPYIGPWIGAVPVVLISLIQDPWMGIRALVCILVIQIVDNLILTPRILGGKMGISPLLVLIGLCVGGTLFGFIGMVIGDVLAAIVKMLFYDSFINRRLHRKVASGELPAEYEPESADDETKNIQKSHPFKKIRNIFTRNKK